MPARPTAAAPRLRPGFGPPLTAVLRRRLGIRPAVTLALVAGLVVLLGAIMALVRPGGDDGTQIVHRGVPVFNVLHGDALAPVAPAGDELLRLEGERGPVSTAVTVRPLELPAATGDVPHALLPMLATRHADALAGRYDGFRLTGEGRARVNDAPGYEVSFTAEGAGGRIAGSDVLLVPSDTESDGAVLLSYRREIEGDAAPGPLSFAARSAFRSFRYGTDRG